MKCSGTQPETRRGYNYFHNCPLILIYRNTNYSYLWVYWLICWLFLGSFEGSSVALSQGAGVNNGSHLGIWNPTLSSSGHEEFLPMGQKGFETPALHTANSGWFPNPRWYWSITECGPGGSLSTNKFGSGGPQATLVALQFGSWHWTANPVVQQQGTPGFLEHYLREDFYSL